MAKGTPYTQQFKEDAVRYKQEHPELSLQQAATNLGISISALKHRFSADEILKRDKTSLDIFWLKDKSLADLDNLPNPDELADDIIENLESALESFKELRQQLNNK